MKGKLKGHIALCVLLRRNCVLILKGTLNVYIFSHSMMFEPTMSEELKVSLDNTEELMHVLLDNVLDMMDSNVEPLVALLTNGNDLLDMNTSPASNLVDIKAGASATATTTATTTMSTTTTTTMTTTTTTTSTTTTTTSSNLTSGQTESNIPSTTIATSKAYDYMRGKSKTFLCLKN